MSYRSDRHGALSLQAALEGAVWAEHEHSLELQIPSCLGRCQVFELMRHDDNGRCVDYVAIEIPKPVVSEMMKYGGATWKLRARDRRSWESRLIRDTLRRDGWPV